MHATAFDLCRVKVGVFTGKVKSPFALSSSGEWPPAFIVGIRGHRKRAFALRTGGVPIQSSGDHQKKNRLKFRGRGFFYFRATSDPNPGPTFKGRVGEEREEGTICRRHLRKTKGDVGDRRRGVNE